jgi:hypothetical protein
MRNAYMLLAFGVCLFLALGMHSQTGTPAPQPAPSQDDDTLPTEPPPPPPPIAVRAPGLWEVTSTVTWQRSPIPAAGNPAWSSQPHSSRYCVTADQVNVYVNPKPQELGKQCRITNVWKRSNGWSAEWNCGGSMPGKGTAETTWASKGYAAGKVHFAGVLWTGSEWAPVEYTMESRSVFKSPDCGGVKPIPTPAN